MFPWGTEFGWFSFSSFFSLLFRSSPFSSLFFLPTSLLLHTFSPHLLTTIANEKNEIFTPAVTVQATSMDIGTMWVQGRLEVHFEMTPKIDETFLLVRFGEQEIVSSSVDNGRWPAMTFSVLSIEDVNELEVEVWSGDLKIGSTLEYKTTVKLQRHANGEAKLLLTSTENNSISKRIQKWVGAKPELKARYSYTPNKNFKNPAKPISVSPSFFTAARGYRTSHSVAIQKLKVKHAKEIADLCYLLVPGFGTTPFPGYFDGNRDVLKGLGATCVKQSEISTFGSLENNAKKISTEVLALSNQHKKKVVVIGHSKGALDIAGLVLKHKTTLSHVDGVILAQGVSSSVWLFFRWFVYLYVCVGCVCLASPSFSSFSPPFPSPLLTLSVSPLYFSPSSLSRYKADLRNCWSQSNG